jgi:hypothetical protein
MFRAPAVSPCPNGQKFSLATRRRERRLQYGANRPFWSVLTVVSPAGKAAFSSKNTLPRGAVERNICAVVRGRRAVRVPHPASVLSAAVGSALNVTEKEVDSECQSGRSGDQPYPLSHRKSAYSCKPASIRLSGLCVNHLIAPLVKLINNCREVAVPYRS